MSAIQIVDPLNAKPTLPAPLDTWAGTRTEYPRDKSVSQLFEEAAAKFADRTAVVCGGTRLTYGELNRWANRLANRLRQEGVRPETKVGVCVERSAEMIVALIAILKAGGAYVPLDAAYPRERLMFMMADTKTPVVVTQKSCAVVDPSVKAIFVEDEFKGAEENLPSTAGATNLAYVMYTSGSTGRPKGVLVEHRAIVRLVFETNYCRFGPEETFLQFAPISFDASTLEIWGALLHGGKLVVMPPQALSLEEIGRAIREHCVTTAWLTAGLFHLFVDERLEDLRPLRQLLAGGDTLSAKHVRRVLEVLPKITLINGYGPTEGTTFTTCHVMRPGDAVPDSVPIGKPIANTRVYILDEEMRPVRRGEAGELFAAGDGVARGYLNSAGATGEKFLQDIFSESADARMYRTGDFARWRDDGSVEFLGRKDGQTKILGHRIEVGEIEAVLTDHPSVRQACVNLDVDEAGTKRLVAYCVPRADVPLASSELKSFLSNKLPAHMVPAQYVSMPNLPLTVSGKIDRGNLPRPAMQGGTRVETTFSNDMEQLVAEIWTKTLRIEQAVLDENFFDLGGDSLLLVAVHSQLQKRLEREIPVTDLFEQATIRSLAKHLGQNGVGEKSFQAAQDRAQKQKAAFAKQRELKVSKPA